MVRYYNRYEPPVKEQPVNQRFPVEDNESIRSLYQILSDAVFQSGDTLNLPRVNLTVSSLAMDTDDATVYVVESDRKNSIPSFLRLDHTDETVVYRRRTFYRGDGVEEKVHVFEVDVHVRKSLEQHLTFE